MRYLCVHCDHRFEAEGEGKPRCPKCMRVHGIEKLSEGKAGPRGSNKAAARPKWLWPGVAAGAIAVAVGAYALWANKAPDTVSDRVPLRPLEPTEIAGHLGRLDVRERSLSAFFDASPGIEEFASAAVSGKSSPVDRARAVVAALRARARKQAFVPWSLSSPRNTPVKNAARAYDAIHRDNGRAQLYPLEVAVVAVSALRSEGVDAMVAEIFGFPGDTSPPDPSGHLGYYGVAVYRGEVGHGRPTILDPYAGREVAPEQDDVRVLNDVQVMAAVLNTRAIHRLVHDGDSERALEDSTSALHLDRRSPSVRGVRGAILISSGGTNEGVQEFEAAAQIRADAPRQNNLAAIYLVKGELEAASREIARALERGRDFAAAHGTLAAIHLARGEHDEAQRELLVAERLDPDLATLPMLWANYFLGQGDIDQAIGRARDGVRRRPDDLQGRLMLARIYRQASRYDEMRTEARAVLEGTPEARKDDMRQLLLQMLGETALEEPMAADEGEGEGGGAGEGGGLHLGSRLLGEGEPGEGAAGSGQGASLLGGGEGQGGGNGPLLRMGDQSKLRLGEPGQGGLRLQLNE